MDKIFHLKYRNNHTFAIDPTEKPKVGDWGLNIVGDYWFNCTNEHDEFLKDARKIVATSYPELKIPYINPPYHIFTEMGKLNYLVNDNFEIIRSYKIEGFADGFKKSIKERKWSDKDIMDAVEYGFWYATQSQNDGKVPEGNILQWMKNREPYKLAIAIEVEMIPLYNRLDYDDADEPTGYKLPILDNGDLHIKDYIYE